MKTKQTKEAKEFGNWFLGIQDEIRRGLEKEKKQKKR